MPKWGPHWGGHPGPGFHSPLQAQRFIVCISSAQLLNGTELVAMSPVTKTPPVSSLNLGIVRLLFRARHTCTIALHPCVFHVPGFFSLCLMFSVFLISWFLDFVLPVIFVPQLPWTTYMCTDCEQINSINKFSTLRKSLLKGCESGSFANRHVCTTTFTWLQLKNFTFEWLLLRLGQMFSPHILANLSHAWKECMTQLCSLFPISSDGPWLTPNMICR